MTLNFDALPPGFPFSNLPLLPADELEALQHRFGGDHGAGYSAAWWVCVAISTTLFVMRLFDRVLYSGAEKQRLRADDWLLGCAWVAMVCSVALAEVMRSVYAMGSGLEEVYDAGVGQMMKLNLMATVLGMISIALTKLSIAALYYMWIVGDDPSAVTTLPQKSMRMSLWILTGVLVIAGVIFPLAYVFACGADVELHWTVMLWPRELFLSYLQSLVKITSIVDAHFAVDMITDIAFVLLACPIIYSLRVSKRELFAIATGLTIGACSAIAGGIRVSVAHAQNGVACLLTWLIAESSLLLILASGLSLHALFTRLFKSRPRQPQVRVTSAPHGVPQFSNRTDSLVGSSSGSGPTQQQMAHTSWSKHSYKSSGVFGSVGRSSTDVRVGSGSLYDGLPGNRSFGGIHLPGSRGDASTNSFEIKPVEKLRIIRQDGKLMVERVDPQQVAVGGRLWGDDVEAAGAGNVSPKYERLSMMFGTKR